MVRIRDAFDQAKREVARALVVRMVPVPSVDAPIGSIRYPVSAQAKVAAGRRIGDEEQARAWEGGVLPRNNPPDAMRHARWSQRMAEEIDPLLAAGAGVQHEIANVVDSVAANGVRHLTRGRYEDPDAPTTRLPQTIAESLMDMRNNVEGLVAAAVRRPIDPGRLTTRPPAPSGYGQRPVPPAEYDPQAAYPPYKRP